MRSCRSRARRGVLLLIILALLAMFGLVAVAFVVIAGHSMRGAQAIQRIGQSETRPEEDLHEAFLQVVRGPTNASSRLGPHSLLEDVYGQVPIPGFDDDGDGTTDEPDEILWYRNNVAADLDTTICGGQLIELTVLGGVRRMGAVLTMLTGATAGQSTRIVGINPTNGKCQLLAFALGRPSPGDEYVINGMPFSGTGFGFDPATGKLDLADPVLKSPLALLPGAPQNLKAPGGANEDYDAVDFQNMLLAAQVCDQATGQVTTTIPSLHRPELVNYWMNQATAGWATNLPLQSRVILRPLMQDHYVDLNNNGQWDQGEPDFTGKVFDPINGPWDVDNDGDFLPDGIWVDLGMPVRSTPDGRLYKPLFSILCLDLDGRLNLNAHGCPAQADPTDNTGPGGGPDGIPDYYDPGVLGGNLKFAGGVTAALLPRGQGYGPAEVNLAVLFASTNPPSVQDIGRYRQLLVGNGAVDGRYGETGVAVPGPGRSAADDLLSQNLGFQFWDPSPYYPPNWSYWGFLGSLANYRADGYGTPPDLNANGYLGLDLAGRPLYWWMAEPKEQVDDPYEIDLSLDAAHGLSSPAPIDNPFGVGELERLLRPFDRDVGELPKRLAFLTDPAPADPWSRSSLHRWRHAITTESWDLPCPSVALPKALRDALPGKRAGHITDLLRAKKVPENVWKDLLPPEMLAGRKMDLNRPLGNGRDDNGNGVVDEPGEGVYPGSPEQLALYRRPGDPPVAVPFSYDTDGNPGDSLMARQLHARHLYVLLMLLADTDYLKAQLGTDEEVARFLAQWAVNVVDFYDRDSIMTPFPFDPDPFDASGWNAPVGYPPAGWNPQYVVWGCERPELLITETLAFHARRTEDLEDPGKRTDDKEKPDEDFDQKKRPQGSLFVEIFNPWTAMEPPPGEFCREPTSGTWAAGVRLNQTTPNGQPVWRLAIVEVKDDPKNTGEQADPDDPQTTNRPDIERSVYFVDPSALGPPGPEDKHRYYPSDPSKILPVMPGRYAVVGPGETNAKSPSHTKTYIGFRSGQQSGDGNTRQIDLTGPTLPQPNVVKNNNDSQLVLNNVYPPAVIVIDSPHRLSVSEPTDGYSLPAGATSYDPISEEYDVAGDEPLDKTDNTALWDVLKVNQTIPKFRIVHLQRLANPLLPWNAEANPYLTIDSMPVDLTAFNGVTSETNQNANGDGDTDGTTKFVSRERGRKEAQTGGISNVWKQENAGDPLPAATNPAVQNHYFNDPLQHSLGYLNECFYLNSPTKLPLDASTGYKGDPPQPFPWLTWNNRPFVSQLELLLVPVLRSSKLLVRNATDEHKYFRFVKAGVDPKPYDPPATPQANNVPYPHLLNFFQSEKRGDPAHSSPQLHRLLEYVGVPSRFVGTQLQGNPDVFQQGANNHSFHPPFNLISRYREPGRINLNTIFSRDVWLGLMNYFPETTNALYWRWDEFVPSRRGYDNAPNSPTDMLSMNPQFPTRFARPFRSFAGADMVPLPQMTPAREIDATLLRSDPDTPDLPLFIYRTNTPYHDTNRNPYFSYQGLQRLGNLVTTRSNVYAIWITVGYFEVEPAPAGYDPSVYPDGYRLVQELGIDSGEVKRHRAFYIFDRSIPVGFRRGQDLNVENAVLVERFIE